MRTKLLVFAAAIALSFTFMGCKGGNTPENPSESNPKYTYDASTRKYEVTMNDGQKLYFAVVALEIREGVATKLDTALTLISYPNYMRGDDKSKTDEEPYLYKGNVSVPATIVLDKRWTVHAMMEQVCYYCKELTFIELPTTINKISYNAFAGCKQLKKVSLYATLIDDGAFYECSALEAITCYSTTPPRIGNPDFYNAEVFYNVPKFDLYVPQASIDAYKNSEWKNYTKNILPIE